MASTSLDPIHGRNRMDRDSTLCLQTLIRPLAGPTFAQSYPPSMQVIITRLFIIRSNIIINSHRNTNSIVSKIPHWTSRQYNEVDQKVCNELIPPRLLDYRNQISFPKYVLGDVKYKHPLRRRLSRNRYSSQSSHLIEEIDNLERAIRKRTESCYIQGNQEDLSLPEQNNPTHTNLPQSTQFIHS